MELYARVRRAVVVDKMSEREAAKQFGLARETVRKMLRYSVQPGYRRQQPARRPKLDAWVGAIDRILEDDKAEGRKQRHTAKRIFERMRDEHGYRAWHAGQRRRVGSELFALGWEPARLGGWRPVLCELCRACRCKGRSRGGYFKSAIPATTGQNSAKVPNTGRAS